MEKKKFDKVKYNNDYTQKHYTQIMFRIRNDRADILEHLKKQKSVNAYLIELIERDLNEEK